MVDCSNLSPAFIPNQTTCTVKLHVECKIQFHHLLLAITGVRIKRGLLHWRSHEKGWGSLIPACERQVCLADVSVRVL